MQIKCNLLLGLMLSLATLSPVAQAQKVKMPKDSDIRKIAKWMTGRFDTFLQVEQDENQNLPYLHTRALVYVIPVAISGMEPNGAAFYVENQAANTRNKPYRQRVYFLQRVNGNVVMRIYRIKSDTDFINAYQKPELFKNLTVDRLNQEIGCDIAFQKVNSKLYRGTAGNNKTCKSNLRGATYATSKTDLTPETWTNLDQGFDDAGAHKWGPPPGTIGHIFIRRR